MAVVSVETGRCTRGNKGPGAAAAADEDIGSESPDSALGSNVGAGNDFAGTCGGDVAEDYVMQWTAPAAPPSLCISMTVGPAPHAFGRSPLAHWSARSPIVDEGVNG